VAAADRRDDGARAGPQHAGAPMQPARRTSPAAGLIGVHSSGRRRPAKTGGPTSLSMSSWLLLLLLPAQPGRLLFLQQYAVQLLSSLLGHFSRLYAPKSGRAPAETKLRHLAYFSFAPLVRVGRARFISLGGA
jgi:hypothetical protein